jgi:hypothetical protein
MLNDIGLEFLIDHAYLGIYHDNHLKSINDDNRHSSLKYNSILKIVLCALLAIEKFAHTSESKYILRRSLTIEHEQSTSNLLMYYETWSQSTHCLQRQIGRVDR